MSLFTVAFTCQLCLFRDELVKSGKSISHEIIFSFDMPDVQVIFLQGQTSPHKSLILVLHPMDGG